MIFQERAKKNYDVEFHIGKHTNDVVHEYISRTLERESPSRSYQLAKKLRPIGR